MNYPRKILMVRPNNFEIAYKINPFMNSTANQIIAMKQWNELKEIYIKLGFEVIIKEDVLGLPDMVFCANPIFSFPKGILLSKMKFPQREKEVDHFSSWFPHLKQIQIDQYFEGMGDLLWNYQKQSLFGGYGFRSNDLAYPQIEKILNKKIIKLKLIDQNFYHLDTCLCIINNRTALYVKSAFEKDAQQLLKSSFEHLIEVDYFEAINFLACNAHSPNGENIIIEKRATKLQKILKEQGFKLHPINTSEYLKSGGSIFCMKHQGWF